MTGNPLLDAIFYLHTQNALKQAQSQYPSDPYAGMNSTEGAAPNQPGLMQPNTGGYQTPYNRLQQQPMPPSIYDR